MDDPWVRKTTTPQPVLAPKKTNSDQTPEDVKLKKKKPNSENNSDVEIQSTPQPVVASKRSNSEENPENANLKKKKPNSENKSSDQTPEDVKLKKKKPNSENNSDVEIQSTPQPVVASKRSNSEENPENANLKKKKPNSENKSDIEIQSTPSSFETPLESKKNILEKDLEVSEDEDETQKSVKYIIDSMIVDAIKQTTEIKNKMESKRKEPISKEFISSDEEDNAIQPKKTKPDEKKKTILISPIKKTQCRYIFKNKPKKGERCPNFTNGVFCVSHSKTDEKSSKPKPRATSENTMKFEGRIRDLQLNAQELTSKLDYVMTEIKKKNESDEVKKKIQDLEITIQNLKQNQNSKISSKVKKLHKLNKNVIYELIGYDDEGNAKLKSNTNVLLVKIPKSLEKPNEKEGKKLKFNKEKGLFEFINKN